MSVFPVGLNHDFGQKNMKFARIFFFEKDFRYDVS